MKRQHALAVVVVALALGSAFAAACSSDDEEPPAKPPPDAGTPFIEDGSIDDAATPVDAPSGPFCKLIDASAVVFCSDFESSGGLFGFDQSFVAADASATFGVSDEGGSAHPSRLLDLSLSQIADDAGTGTEAGTGVFLTKELPTGKAPNTFLHHEVELDFRVVGPASLPYAALTVLAFPSAAIKEHGFAAYDGTIFGRLVPKDLAVKDGDSKWHHAHLVLARPAAGSTSSFRLTIDIDGTLVDNISGVDPGTGSSALRVGAFATSPSQGGSIRAQFDNVVVRRW